MFHIIMIDGHPRYSVHQQLILKHPWHCIAIDVHFEASNNVDGLYIYIHGFTSSSIHMHEYLY